MNEVQVTNTNSFPLPGRFAGEDYTFPPNKPVAISMLAARHIFQIGQEDKRRALAQLGILKGTVTYEEALAVLKKVKFVEGQMEYRAQQNPGQQGPGGGQQRPDQPGQKPGEHKDTPDKEKKGPGKDEESEESEESGGRPGAPRNPGRKSEAADQQSAASDDLSHGKRKW